MATIALCGEIPIVYNSSSLNGIILRKPAKSRPDFSSLHRGRGGTSRPPLQMKAGKALNRRPRSSSSRALKEPTSLEKHAESFIWSCAIRFVR